MTAPATVRYAAFLRGVSPVYLSMPDLKKCLEGAGWSDVHTLLSSGNVIFSARPTPQAKLIAELERAMKKELDRVFPVFLRQVRHLSALVKRDPFADLHVPRGGKRVVTFLRKPPGKLSLPIVLDGAHILAVDGHEAFSAYTPTPKGPVFMSLLQKTFGEDITTRTWDTLSKVAADKGMS